MPVGRYGQLVDQIESLATSAITALVHPRWLIADAAAHVPPSPGLYSIHGDSTVWCALGLLHRKGVPLYVGKSESSMVSRELEGHFAVDPLKPARTGSSTVRRAFAALLATTLNLDAFPRGHLRRRQFSATDFTNYELSTEGDARLTAWMHKSLALATWAVPLELPLATLGLVEVSVIRRWTPPINIRDNPSKSLSLRAQRERMAAQARDWSPVA